MTGDLGNTFRRLIAAHGPISVARFMGEANAHYYATRDPLGAAGDFVTAPEISQMFGELVGLWLADMWHRAGRPDTIRYVELGPGRGTLARDALRAMAQAGLRPQVHFVEGSPALAAIQLQAIPTAQVHGDLSQVPADGAMLLVANEFFDALPVRQWVRLADGWRERLVGIDDAGQFVFSAVGEPLEIAAPDMPEGTIIETRPAAAAIMQEIAARLVSHGGAALVIDYGHAVPRTGSTLQAVSRHRKVDPFASIGEADLTAHVDFAALASTAVAHGARALGCVGQGAWLTKLGIAARTQALAKAAPGQQDAVMQAAHRLTASDQMGDLFKVLGLASPEWPTGAGF